MNGMVFGIVGVFIGYTLGSYGVVLLRDYDIHWTGWINPIHPYQWPSGTVPSAPPTVVLPKG